MTFVDLFSGIGGFALGARMAGMAFDKHFFSEVDDYAIKVYRKNFSEAVPLGDITKVDWQSIRKADFGRVHRGYIIAGGFPCQDISLAGLGAGITGHRSGLWSEMWAAIRILQPRFAIIENVGAIAFRGLYRVLENLAEIGYDAEWLDIRAADVGAPHRRERLWIVAYPNSEWQSQPPGHEQELGRRSGNGGENLGNADGERRKKLDHRQSDRPWHADSTTGRTETMADAGSGRHGSAQGSLYAGGPTSFGRGLRRFEGTWRGRHPEPAIRGIFNGFSSWLDSNRLTADSHKLFLAYGKTNNTDNIEALRILFNGICAASNQWSFGGQGSVRKKEILLTYLLKLKERTYALYDLFAQSSEVQENILRGLWTDDKPSYSSQKWQAERQQTKESTDALHALSSFLALDAKENWETYWRDNAKTYLNRVDRNRCLGNSIVPQIAALIFARIKDIVK